jgi:hypothetical protein
VTNNTGFDMLRRDEEARVARIAALEAELAAARKELAEAVELIISVRRWRLLTPEEKVSRLQRRDAFLARQRRAT